jgi:acyl carrier protein
MAFAPTTPNTQSIVSRIWCEVLEVNRLDPNDDFFDLIGDSLLATQVALRIRQAFHIELPLQCLFEARTIEHLSNIVDEQVEKRDAPLLVPILPVARGARLPLSYAQQRLWMVHQLDPHTGTYNMALSLRFRGQLDVAMLEASIGEIVNRHESLRTSFHEQDGEVWQEIAPSVEFVLKRIEIAEAASQEPEIEVVAQAVKEIDIPFELESAPLMRGLLMRLGAEDNVLVVTMHHIVSDDWSMNVFVQELLSLYRSRVSGASSEMRPLPIQYGDYAVWQRNTLTAEKLEPQLAYWRNQLQGAPQVISLPTKGPRPKVQSFRGALQQAELDAPLLESLRSLCQQQGATLFMALMTAFQVLLSKYSGNTDIVIGTDLANRTQIELERLIGFFVNVLPIRTDLSGDPSFAEALLRAKGVALEAYAHQETPFDKLVEDLSPERTLSHNPVVQVLCVMHKAINLRSDIPNLHVSELRIPLTRSRFDLVLFVQEDGNKVLTQWLYSTDLFEAETIARMTEHYKTVIEEVYARPECRISAIEHLTTAERSERESSKNLHRSEKKAQLRFAKRKPVQ